MSLKEEGPESMDPKTNGSWQGEGETESISIMSTILDRLTELWTQIKITVDYKWTNYSCTVATGSLYKIYIGHLAAVHQNIIESEIQNNISNIFHSKDELHKIRKHARQWFPIWK